MGSGSTSRGGASGAGGRRGRRGRRRAGDPPRETPPPARDETTPPAPALNWIVPARRAVVRSRISYGELLNLWDQELVRCVPVLAGWYYSGSQDDAVRQIIGGISMLRGWLRAETHAAALIPPDDGAAQSAVLDGPSYRVRLWKGPLRVLKELAERGRRSSGSGGSGTGSSSSSAGSSTRTSTVEEPADLGGAGADDPEDEDDHIVEPGQSTDAVTDGAAAPSSLELERRPPAWHLGRATGGTQIRLELDERRAAVPGTTNFFLPGDVVEFPIWKILLRTRQYTELEFNPDGSFLLGTSVRKIGETTSPPADLPLHENALFMRYQSIYSVARGAFHSLQALWRHRGAQEFSHLEFEGERVDARGLMYAASLVSGNGTAPDVWLVQNNHWGTRMRVPRESEAHAQSRPPSCLPTSNAMNALDGGHLTPGWTCTPSQCFFFTYMLKELRARHYVFSDPMNDCLRPHVDPTKHSMLLGAGGSERKVYVDLLDPFVGRVASPRYRGFESFIREQWEEANRYGLIRPSSPTRHGLTASPDPMPVGTWAVAPVIAMLDAVRERQEAMRRRHRSRRQVADYRVRSARAADLAAAEAAATAEGGTAPPPPVTPPPLGTRPGRGDMLRDLSDLTLRRLTAGNIPADSTGDDATRPADGWPALEAHQASRAAATRTRSRREPPAAKLDAVFHRDDGYWQQVNCVVQGNHSFGVVRLRPADDLRDEAVFDADGHVQLGSPPYTGFLCAYDPLTGRPEVGEHEELHRFEAAGSLAHFFHDGVTYHICGSSPHHVDRVPRFEARYIDGLKIHLQRMPVHEDSAGTARTEAIVRIRDEVLAELHAEPQAYEPIGLKSIASEAWLGRHPLALYAERAVPTPTFEEAQADDAQVADVDKHVMPTIGSARTHLATVKAWVEEVYSRTPPTLARFSQVDTLLKAVGSTIRFRIQQHEGGPATVERADAGSADEEGSEPG